MNLLPAVLIFYERDALFREALHNSLLAAGYLEVEVAATFRDALTRLRCQCYGHVLIGAAKPFSRGRRLAAIARRRQPEAKILLLVNSEDQPPGEDSSFECLLKEHVFSNLPELM